jgi:hypothetical protein
VVGEVAGHGGQSVGIWLGARKILTTRRVGVKFAEMYAEMVVAGKTSIIRGDTDTAKINYN